MDEKTINTLEYPKILERLAAYASFSASAEMARSLLPCEALEESKQRLAVTTEARLLLDTNLDIHLGGAHDVRALTDLANHGGVLAPSELLDIKETLLSARNLGRTFSRQSAVYPNLAAIASGLNPPKELIEAISRSISDRGEVLDQASDKLGSIRRELKISHDRLMSRLERILNDPKVSPMLQEAIITQRNGRYVVPLRADFKGKLRSIIHDQSSSGVTLFVEPLVVVELNNRYHELQLGERDEERRILAEISALVGKHSDLIELIVVALAHLDLALMCARYADDLHAVEPVLLPYKKGRENHPGCTIKLYQARHPLLDQKSVVPIDVDLDDETFSLVITGPNTGGKTVTLKTVGLLALMAQSGLHIPAQSGSALSIFKNIYADIGDEQSIEQSLSTFSGHITNIVRILTFADTHGLVLLDELGAGTDPQEGAALARSILSYLVERRIPCLVATHYPELKAFAHGTAGATNASMEFDLQTLRPTYHLTIGLPGRSNALLIANRLGLPKEIIESARNTLNPVDLRADDLLDEIHHQRDLAHQARAAAEYSRKEAEKLRAELSRRLEKIEDERLATLEKSRAQAEEELLALQQEVEDVRRALSRARQPLDAIKPLQEQVTTLQESTEKPVERQQPEVMSSSQPIRLGRRVRIRSLKMEGLITSVNETDVEIQLGNLRVRAKLNDIQPISETEEPQTPASGSRGAALPPSSGGSFHSSPGMELDLRGQRAEEALDILERYLESAYLAGLPFARIIHGKGTGRLRQAVRQAVQQSVHVANWETGSDNEGGDGVTIVHLTTD